MSKKKDDSNNSVFDEFEDFFAAGTAEKVLRDLGTDEMDSEDDFGFEGPIDFEEMPIDTGEPFLESLLELH